MPNPTTVKPIPDFDVLTLRSIFGKVAESESGCWEWQGALSPNGYATVTVNYVPYLVHRIFYSHLVERLNPEMVLDHLCRNPKCCNPFHLEQVSDMENIMRGESNAAENARKEMCVRGHRFTHANTYVDGRGWRQCRQCNSGRDKGKRRAKTHCRNGHELTPENTRYRATGRTCRSCQVASESRYRDRKKNQFTVDANMQSVQE